jgi:flagellin-like hook-associated protein FlgL
MGDISLSSSIRANVLSLQQTTSLMDRTQGRLSTGKEVNSAVDDPARFFAAQQHKNRANDLLGLKADMGEAIQAIKAADKGITAINSLLQQMKGIATAARSATGTAVTDLEDQFDALRTQVTQLASDSGYKGTNFLTGSSLQVNFNEAATSNVTVTGQDVATATGYLPAVAGDFTDPADIDTAVSEVNTAISTFRSLASTLSTNLSVITARQDFTSELAEVLETGADNLTNADTNREGANLLALQTRQQLGTIALSMSSQSSQAVLRLF